jgi:hypothetical protein
LHAGRPSIRSGKPSDAQGKPALRNGSCARYLLLGLFEVVALCSAREACGLTFASLGDVAFGEFGAFAEEKLLHLLFHDFLRAWIERVEAELVHHHF